MITKIISGGQTGADQGALRAAVTLGLKTGGWAPKDFKTEDGYNPALAVDFGLQEHSSPRYPERTQSNVLGSDGTLLFGNLHSHGTALTRHYCQTYCKPFFSVEWAFSSHNFPQVCDIRFLTWLESNDISVLNVAGNRESKNPGIFSAVRYFLLVNLETTLKPSPKPASSLTTQGT